jgi:DNA polymerase-3 subunit delta
VTCVPVITAGAVRRHLDGGAASPLYVLYGDDDIEKLALARDFEALVPEDVRPFNVDRIHAGDWTSGERLAAGVAAIAAAARTLPLMAPRRVVIVFQAEALFAPRRESAAAVRALGELEDLVKRPEPATVLVFVAAGLDRRSRMYKLLQKEANLVPSGVLEERGDVERWIVNRITAGGAEIAPGAVRLLAERCGTDVSRLRNDVERLQLYTLGQAAISLDDVRAIAGPESLQDEWAVTNAIEAGNAAEALRQLALMIEAGVAPEKILGQLAWVVRTKSAGLQPDAVTAGVEAVFRTDLDLKRSAGEPRILLERLIVELCAGRRRGAAPRR